MSQSEIFAIMYTFWRLLFYFVNFICNPKSVTILICVCIKVYFPFPNSFESLDVPNSRRFRTTTIKFISHSTVCREHVKPTSGTLKCFEIITFYSTTSRATKLRSINHLNIVSSVSFDRPPPHPSSVPPQCHIVATDGLGHHCKCNGRKVTKAILVCVCVCVFNTESHRLRSQWAWCRLRWMALFTACFNVLYLVFLPFYVAVAMWLWFERQRVLCLCPSLCCGFVCLFVWKLAQRIIYRAAGWIQRTGQSKECRDAWNVFKKSQYTLWYSRRVDRGREMEMGIHFFDTSLVVRDCDMRAKASNESEKKYKIHWQKGSNEEERVRMEIIIACAA